MRPSLDLNSQNIVPKRAVLPLHHPAACPRDRNSKDTAQQPQAHRPLVEDLSLKDKQRAPAG